MKVSNIYFMGNLCHLKFSAYTTTLLWFLTFKFNR
uniref:Uncharacterized protein n=1 Tax=Rhizophora mucronata TaxID=61149 RepID=A0A2P2QW43_RHIMU